MFPYFTLEEISTKSGLSNEQILRLGMNGTLIFSVVENQPQNFEEINETEDEEGNSIILTKQNTSIVLLSSSKESLILSYISTPDLVNIVTNEAPNRKTLINAVFSTRNIDPKHGKFLTNPLRVSLTDIVLKSEEWSLFTKGNGKSLKNMLPLAKPEKVTLSWLWSNFPLSMWFKIILLFFAALSFGIYLGQSELYVEAMSKLSSTYKPN